MKSAGADGTRGHGMRQAALVLSLLTLLAGVTLVVKNLVERTGYRGR